jgi:peptide-methionine (S)-S-oxide reductase
MRRSVLPSLFFALSAVLLLAGCGARSSASDAGSSASGAASGAATTAADDSTQALDPAVADTATFAGGCFWCMEPPFDKLDGVAATVSGYAGGSVANPSYEQVTAGTTGHAESLRVVYDSTKVSYEDLLYVFWRNIDPLDNGGQFCDRGSSYRPVLFVHDARQRRLAEQSKQQIAQRFDQPLKVPIEPLDAFYRAETYHQNYYQKNPTRYKTYRRGCGRDARLQELWGEEAGGQPLASK